MRNSVDMPMLNPKLRALQYLFFCKASGRVVAHCLNLDIVTAANDVDEAEKRLDLLVRKRIECALAVGNWARQVFCVNGSFFSLRRRLSGRWKSGNPGFGFPLFHRPKVFLVFGVYS